MPKKAPQKNKTIRRRKGVRKHTTWGSFDALPPVYSTKSTRDDEDEGAGEDGAKNQSCDRKKKKQKINERDDVIETRREPSPTTQKEEPSSSTMDDWLEKLAKHANRKFETCSRAFLELLSKPDALERKHGKKIVLVMRKTMETHPQSEEYRKETAKRIFQPLRGRRTFNERKRNDRGERESDIGNARVGVVLSNHARDCHQRRLVCVEQARRSV